MKNIERDIHMARSVTKENLIYPKISHINMTQTLKSLLSSKDHEVMNINENYTCDFDRNMATGWKHSLAK